MREELLRASADPVEAISWLAETEFWSANTLSARPYLYVL